MVPLRMVAIIGNVVFISYALLGLYYGIFEKVYPIFVLHLLLLPLNIIRVYQIKQLIREIGEASAHEPSVEYLIPHMKKEGSIPCFLGLKNRPDMVGVTRHECWPTLDLGGPEDEPCSAAVVGGRS